MFESSPEAERKIGSDKRKEPRATFNWSAMPVEDLIRYRDEITKHLPPLDLKDINLQEELLLQFHALRALQGQVLNDDEVPLNQRAQLANSVGSTLDRLVELQEKVWSQERFKTIENTLIRHLKRLPEDVAEAFLADYEALLRPENGQN